MSRRKLMGVITVAIAVLIVCGSGTYVLFKSKKTGSMGMPHVGEIALSFSELPTLNKTVNVTLTGKTKNEGPWIGLGGGFIFFKNESAGFEWVRGKPSLKPYEINETEQYGEIEEPYFVYKNCTVWGEPGKMIQLKGSVKAVKTGNWTLGGFFCVYGYYPLNYSTDHPSIIDTGNRSAKEWWLYGDAWRHIQLFTRIVIHVGLDSSYIVEEERYEPWGYGPPTTYYYYNLTQSEGTSHETPSSIFGQLAL